MKHAPRPNRAPFKKSLCTKIILLPHNRRIRIWTENLIRLLFPFRMVHGIDPALGLDHDAAVLWHVRLCAVGGVVLLGFLDGHGGAGGVTGVDLQGALVGFEGEADAGCG